MPNGTESEESALGGELFKRLTKKVADTIRDVFYELKSFGFVAEDSSLDDLMHATALQYADLYFPGDSSNV